MLKLQKKQYLFIIVASVLLFILNNIILGAIVPRLPGGSAFGITTMFFITFLSLKIKKFGCLPLMYLFYGLYGTISHLLALDFHYLTIILLIVISATLLDLFLYKQNYQILAYLFAYPFFVAIAQGMNFGLRYFIAGEVPVEDTKIFTYVITLLPGYIGILSAYLSFRIFRSKSKKYSA